MDWLERVRRVYLCGYVLSQLSAWEHCGGEGECRRAYYGAVGNEEVAQD